jgi:hypothetical protein
MRVAALLQLFCRKNAFYVSAALSVRPCSVRRLPLLSYFARLCFCYSWKHERCLRCRDNILCVRTQTLSLFLYKNHETLSFGWCRAAAFSDNVCVILACLRKSLQTWKKSSPAGVCVPNREVERSRYALLSLSRPTCAKVAKVGIPLGSCDEIVAYLAIFRQVLVPICDARSSKHLAPQKPEHSIKILKSRWKTLNLTNLWNHY